MHPDWIVPDWPAPPGVRAFVTTRAGGVSSAPFASFNVGLSTGDDPLAVRENRARLTALLPREPSWLKQVHGARVVNAAEATDTPQADASLATAPGIVCAVQAADCIPVLFCNRPGTLVAAAHAGWRGLAGGVVDNTVSALAAAGARPADLLAYIGPGIGPGAFEVGDEVREAYTASDPGAQSAFSAHGPGKWLADLPTLVRRALERCGVREVHGGTLCTYSDAARFYSYRRDRVTGRMAALIWRTE